jgi:hypothetical protein
MRAKGAEQLRMHDESADSHRIHERIARHRDVDLIRLSDAGGGLAGRRPDGQRRAQGRKATVLAEPQHQPGRPEFEVIDWTGWMPSCAGARCEMPCRKERTRLPRVVG